MKKLTLNQALKKTVEYIEYKLSTEVYGIQRVIKIYGSNANSFILKTVDYEGRKIDYFLKFLRGKESTQETKGLLTLSEYIPSQKPILSSTDWELFEFIEGKLLSEIVLNNEFSNKFEEILRIERVKEKYLTDMYKKTPKIISRSDYKSSNANALFEQRLTGKRFKEFYEGSNNISKHFNKTITVNGHTFRNTPNQVFSKIKTKYLNKDNDKIKAYLGHGDAHSGNIMITEDNSVLFIDFEYYGYIPVYMELAKPYYNDFIGAMFLTHNNLALEYFDTKTIKDTQDEIKLKIRIKNKMDLRLKITNEKIKIRKELFGSDENVDFLTLNDYLIMCHCLTKDPNNYPPDVQALFLAFIPIIHDFDPLVPKSIFKYF